jgi:uncharacterized protein YndB with AHSA1/START domain
MIKPTGGFPKMNVHKKFIAWTAATIHAPVSEVWGALTKPELIQEYMYGTEVDTDWQEGSPITYRGVWQGKPYEDKGEVVHVEPERRLVSTFWSSLAGKEDVPENYNTVSYELSPEGDGTRLIITQDNNDTPEEARHSEQNWKTALEGLKKMLENR